MASGTKLSLMQRLLGQRTFGLLGDSRRNRKQLTLSAYDHAYILGHTASTDSWHIQVLREHQPAEYIPVSRSTLPVMIAMIDRMTKRSEMTETNPTLMSEFVAALERAEAASARLRAAMEHADRIEVRAQHVIQTSQELIDRAQS